jgi:hypothetical protein
MYTGIVRMYTGVVRMYTGMTKRLGPSHDFCTSSYDLEASLAVFDSKNASI